MVSEPEVRAACRDDAQLTTSASRRQQRVLGRDSDLVKDGISSTDHCSDAVKAEVLRLSTVLPTMWIGTQNGWSVCDIFLVSKYY